VIINPTKGDPCRAGYPSLECRRAGELYLLESAQKGMKTSEARMLATDMVIEDDIIEIRRKLIMIGSRGRNQIEGIYGLAKLPVLPRGHPLS
jgi:hypothetical protein